MSFRKILFWLHVVCGVIAGIIVLIMSVTGIALMYQKQVTAWADIKTCRMQPAAGTLRLSTEKLIERFCQARPGTTPANISISSDPAMPAIITTSTNETIFVNPYTGGLLGLGSQGVRTFFKVMTNWHRWLALSGENRKAGKAVTGAGNIVFLFLALSGLYLWWPSKWTRGMVRTIAWFRGGLSNKARDSNWHYVFGFWCLVPLVFIIVSAVVISYPWASNLVFKMAGSKMSLPIGPPVQSGHRGGPPPGPPHPQVLLQLDGLDRMLGNVQKQIGEWKSISFQPSAAVNRTVSFSVESGWGGQPQLRSTVTVHKATGSIERVEGFKDLDPGLRARLWMRFVHTGEYYGIVGQTIAGIASAAGVILVWTGLALTFRRYYSWMKNRSA
jgi:uncharacterized iron-regulated membrane protein